MHDAAARPHFSPRQHDLLSALLRALLEVLTPVLTQSAFDSEAAADERRVEYRSASAAEEAIRRGYPYAQIDTVKLQRRAKAHGIQFSFWATPAHRAAILDFLDDPARATPLRHMHMTWIQAISQDGAPTASRTHAANRAIYSWNACNLSAARRVDSESQVALRRLRCMFPIERATWTAEQWRVHELGHIAGDRDNGLAGEPRPLSGNSRTSADGIRLSL